jgi:hypothetical protein
MPYLALTDTGQQDSIVCTAQHSTAENNDAVGCMPSNTDDRQGWNMYICSEIKAR